MCVYCIVIRDGVGESQRRFVIEEAEAIKNELKKFKPLWYDNLGLAVVIVSKKVNQRFAVRLTEDLIREKERGTGGRGWGGRDDGGR